MLADLEALRALLVTVATKVAALDKSDRPSSPTWTSRPASWTARTITVTVFALFDAAGGAPVPPVATPAPVRASSCFMPRLMRSFSTSTSRT